MPTTSSPTSTRPSLTPRNAGALVAWLVVAAGLAVLSFAGPDPPPGLLYSYGFTVATLVSFGVLGALTFAISLAYHKPLPALGLQRFARRWLWIALGLIVLAAIVSAALEPILHAGEEQGLAPERWRPERASAFVVNALVVVTVAPLAEELFFRGLGVRALRPLGEAAALVGTALLFALAHGLLAGLPPLFLFGLAVAWVRLRSDSVWPGVFAHGTYNALGIALVVASWFVETG